MDLLALLNLFVFCGAPGSGKTTMSKQFAEQYNAIRYSFDEMKCLQHHELIPYVKESLENGENSVVDFTYTEKYERTNLLKAIEDINCKRTLIFMDTDLDECIQRNSKRPHPLSQFIVESMFYTMQRPTLDEGWDEILYFK